MVIDTRPSSGLTETYLLNRSLENITIPKNPPYMVLIVGPCRVGTTALSNVFARAGCESYMQPIKSMRRALEEGGKIVPWNIKGGNSLVVSKETLGPKTEAELFDPVEILSQAGYPLERLHLIPILREPKMTLASWIRMWGDASIEKFVRTYHLTAKIKALVQASGVAVTPYVHEAIRKNEPGLVMERLLTTTPANGLDFSRTVVDWSKGTTFGEDGSNVVFFDNPPSRFIEGVKERGGYVYRELTPQLSQAQVDALEASGINEVYNTFMHECEQVLGITI